MKFPMQIKRKCFFLLSNIFIFEWYESGIFYCSSRELLAKRMILKSPFMPYKRTKPREQRASKKEERPRENRAERIAFFPSWCTTLAWFQVLNCYFNMTTSHVLHHLHHTPSTHPARLSVDPSCGAVMGHLRNMCRLGARAKNEERNILLKIIL